MWSRTTRRLFHHRGSDSAARPATGPLQGRPRGLLRLLLRLPVWLYRLHLGWLLGHRFLLLTHRGRRSGRVYQTVLEVIRYVPASRESTVVSGWGTRADWYRNIQANPALEVRTGRARYVSAPRFLDLAERYEAFTSYERRHRLAARLVPRIFGLRYDGSPEGRRALAGALAMVAFRPRPRTATDDTGSETGMDAAADRRAARRGAGP